MRKERKGGGGGGGGGEGERVGRGKREKVSQAVRQRFSDSRSRNRYKADFKTVHAPTRGADQIGHASQGRVLKAHALIGDIGKSAR